MYFSICFVQVILVITCAVIALTARGTVGNPVKGSASERDASAVDKDAVTACSVNCSQEAKKCYAACDNETWVRLYCHGQCTFDEVACHGGCAIERL